MAKKLVTGSHQIRCRLPRFGVDSTLYEVGEMLGYVVEHMATEDDIAALRTELKSDIAALGDQIGSTERDLNPHSPDESTNLRDLAAVPG